LKYAHVERERRFLLDAVPDGAEDVVRIRSARAAPRIEIRRPMAAPSPGPATVATWNSPSSRQREQAFLDLAHAWHERCLADPVVSHAFPPDDAGLPADVPAGLGLPRWSWNGLADNY